MIAVCRHNIMLEELDGFRFDFKHPELSSQDLYERMQRIIDRQSLCH